MRDALRATAQEAMQAILSRLHETNDCWKSGALQGAPANASRSCRWTPRDKTIDYPAITSARSPWLGSAGKPRVDASLLATRMACSFGRGPLISTQWHDLEAGNDRTREGSGQKRNTRPEANRAAGSKIRDRKRTARSEVEPETDSATQRAICQSWASPLRSTKNSLRAGPTENNAEDTNRRGRTREGRGRTQERNLVGDRVGSLLTVPDSIARVDWWWVPGGCHHFVGWTSGGRAPARTRPSCRAIPGWTASPLPIWRALHRIARVRCEQTRLMLREGGLAAIRLSVCAAICSQGNQWITN